MCTDVHDYVKKTGFWLFQSEAPWEWHWNIFNIDKNFFVLNMEGNGVLKTLVYYFKNCNTPLFSLLDLEVVLATMLNERE